MNANFITLDKLERGKKGRVIYIDNNAEIKRRFMDMGLIRGAVVECMLISPLGDPKAYLICGALIAIRREDAAKIGICLI